MQSSDGGFCNITPEKNTVSLVLFGRIEPDLKDTLLQSLETFLHTLRGDLRVRPVVVCRHEEEPGEIPPMHQETAFFSALGRMSGSILLGVTNTGLYNPALSRHLFSYGYADGRGVLSTYRFRKETTGRMLFLKRMEKQLVKTLALACTLDSCTDTGCIVSYHRWAADLDRNRYVCAPCRNELAKNLDFFLNPAKECAA